MHWTLHKFTRGPKFVSHRIAVLPYKGAALRQVVVRLRSRQSLTRTVSNGLGRKEKPIREEEQEKDVSEYLVLQRRIMKDREEPWMVWGTTEESDLTTIVGVDTVESAMTRG